MRANPGNKYSLTKLALLLVVPPDVVGESVTMSMKGGIWDGMKRTISWTVGELEPGSSLEIQTQFAVISGRGELKFPVLVRCDINQLFSGIELNSNYLDAQSAAVTIGLEKCSRVLYRKV